MPVVNTTRTFTNNEQITSTKLNEIMDNSLFVSGAVVPSRGLEVTAGGQLQVPNSGITTALLENSSTTSNGVTTAKIANGAVITEKISDSAITTIKLANSTSSTTGVTTAKIADSNVTTAKLANASVVAGKLSGAQTGTAPVYGIRAFASFDGGAASPINTIVEGNIGTITRTATGVFSVTFATSMPSANYTIMANARYLDNNTYEANCFFTSVTASSFVLNVAGGDGNYNSNRIDLMILG
jgi:hypothetical protein